METRVLQLARAGADDAEIARQLTAEGHRSPSRTEVLCSTVQGIRLRHRLKMPPRRTRWAKIPGRLSVPEVATDLGVAGSVRARKGRVQPQDFCGWERRERISGQLLYIDIDCAVGTEVEGRSVPSVPAPSMQALMADRSSETDGRGLE